MTEAEQLIDEIETPEIPLRSAAELYAQVPRMRRQLGFSSQLLSADVLAMYAIVQVMRSSHHPAGTYPHPFNQPVDANFFAEMRSS